MTDTFCTCEFESTHEAFEAYHWGYACCQRCDEKFTKELLAKVEHLGNELDKQENLVNHPAHYQSEKFEVIDIIEEFNLSFCLGNVIKYILRAGKKGNKKQDLEKARWYLSRQIDNMD